MPRHRRTNCYGASMNIEKAAGSTGRRPTWSITTRTNHVHGRAARRALQESTFSLTKWVVKVFTSDCFLPGGKALVWLADVPNVVGTCCSAFKENNRCCLR